MINFYRPEMQYTMKTIIYSCKLFSFRVQVASSDLNFRWCASRAVKQSDALNQSARTLTEYFAGVYDNLRNRSALSAPFLPDPKLLANSETFIMSRLVLSTYHERIIRPFVKNRILFVILLPDRDFLACNDS